MTWYCFSIPEDLRWFAFDFDIYVFTRSFQSYLTLSNKIAESGKCWCDFLKHLATLCGTKIEQTKMLVTRQRFGDWFLFGLVWPYSSNQKNIMKVGSKSLLLTCSSNKLCAYLYYIFLIRNLWHVTSILVCCIFGWRCLLHRLNRLPLAALKKTNLKILRSIMAGISVPTSQQTRWHATMLGRAVRHVNRWADSKPSLVLGRL